MYIHECRFLNAQIQIFKYKYQYPNLDLQIPNYAFFKVYYL